MRGTPLCSRRFFLQTAGAAAGLAALDRPARAADPKQTAADQAAPAGKAKLRFDNAAFYDSSGKFDAVAGVAVSCTNSALSRNPIRLPESRTEAGTGALALVGDPGWDCVCRELHTFPRTRP